MLPANGDVPVIRVVIRIILALLFFSPAARVACAEGLPFITSSPAMTAAIDSHGKLYIWGGTTQYPSAESGIADAVDVDFEVIDGERCAVYVLRANGAVTSILTTINQYANVSGVIDIENDYWGLTYIILKEDGTVWSKGKNLSGALGQGILDFAYSSGEFGKITGLSNIVDIAFGHNDLMHATTGLALRADGTVWCWGRAMQANDPSGDTFPAPRQIQGLNNIIAIARGIGSFIALDSFGSVWTWGRTSPSGGVLRSPQKTTGLDGVVGIAATLDGGLAVRNDGTVWEWGRKVGALTSANAVMYPSPVIGIRNIIKVYTNESAPGVEERARAFAVGAGGDVWAWGNNYLGLLGEGTYEDKIHPVSVLGEHGVGFLDMSGSGANVEISRLLIEGKDNVVSGSATTYSATAVFRDGRTARVNVIWAVNSRVARVNAEGRVSTDFLQNSDSFVLSAVYESGSQRLVSSKSIQVTANTPRVGTPQLELLTFDGYSDQNMVLMRDGTIRAWGDNSYGQLGDSTTRSRSAAVQSNDLTDVMQVMEFYCTTMAVKSDGTVWGWGANFAGLLGDGSHTTRPVRIAGLDNVVHIANAGSGKMYVVKEDGALWLHELDYGSSHLTSSSIPRNIRKINFPLALDADGFVWWIQNSGPGGSFSNFNRIQTLKDIIAISAAYRQSESGTWLCACYALDRAGKVWAWILSRRADYSYEIFGEPRLVSGLDSIRTISTTGQALYAIDVYDRLWVQGSYLTASGNRYTDIPVVVAVDTLDFRSSGRHAIRLAKDGTVWSFGLNDKGQLGNGTIGGIGGQSVVISDSLSSFLDLYPERANNIPPEMIPKFMSAAISEGDNAVRTLYVELNLNALHLSELLDSFAVSSRSAVPVNNVYVAALVPGSILGTSHPAVFTLNSANAWGQYLGGPLPEFMYNVEVASADQRLLLQILTRVNVSNLVGTTIYVGYGTSDAEMLQSGRYRAVYTVSDPGE